ncbi:superoxide dismutase family protein [Saezia sanguinis]|uniref:superoxide dismutase family protein n=1 Tax=Saezia sanguinis TaxID=1965230 RepID=UPI000F8EAE09
MKKTVIAASLMFATALAVAQAEKVIEVNLVDADGGSKPIGTVTAVDSQYGLVLTPNLQGLAPGVHGFHVHVNPDCGPKEQDGKMVAALAAGGHYDPQNTGKHGTPWGDGHLGDLPPLYVAADGTAVTPVLAPRLKVADLAGRSIMVHAGGENYSDHPAPLGGGGARVACGVVK